MQPADYNSNGCGPSFNLLPASGEGDSFIPLAQGQPTCAQTGEAKSFADAVKTGLRFPGKAKSFNAFKSPLPQSFENIHSGFPSKDEVVEVKELTSLYGRPCVYLSDEELSILAKPLELSLIGKFSQGRAKWLSLNRYFMDLRLLGSYKIASLDSRNFVIHLNTFEDYTKIFSKPVATIKVHVVKYFKWTMDFDVNNEPSVTPVWISMTLLKMSMFTQNMLFSIAKAYGKPLLLDPTTALGNNPGVARVLVEMDVLKDQPKDVWIGNKITGYAQVVEIEKKPKYCSHCRKYGHMIHECYTKYPELSAKQRKFEWQVKEAEPNENQNKKTESANDLSGNSSKSGHATPTCDSQLNMSPNKEEQEEDLDEKFWNEYKEQMRLDEESRNAFKDVSHMAEEDGDTHAIFVSKENGEHQEGICESTWTSSEEDETVDVELESARRLAQEVILEVTEKIYEECYNRAFNEECKDQMEKLQSECDEMSPVPIRSTPNLKNGNSAQGNARNAGSAKMVSLNPVSSSDCTIIPNTNEDQNKPGSNIKTGKVAEMAFDTTNLTEMNILDMDCMGFKPERTGSEHDGRMKDIDVYPPQSKSRRRSWGEDDTKEWTTIKHKRGRRKKVEVNIVTSPRKTRGRTRESMKERHPSEDDSS